MGLTADSDASESEDSLDSLDPLDSFDESMGYHDGHHDLEDEETWVCAVCQCYDPIITPPSAKNGKQAEAMTTEWIGCDCNCWYHKYCTKPKHVDDDFSCKQLGRECLPL